MQWIKRVAAEIFGLFVDDGRFALAILAWTGLLWLGSARMRMTGGWVPVAFAGGLVAILVESTLRAARE